MVRTIAFLACLLAPTLVMAQRPSASRLLPDSSLFYARVENVNHFRALFNETSLGRMMQDPEMKPFISGLWRSVTESTENVEQEIGFTWDELLSIPQGEIAVAVVPMETGIPAVVIMLELGEDPATAQKAIEVLENLARQDEAEIDRTTYSDVKITTLVGRRGPLSIMMHDDVLVLSNRVEQIEDLIDSWDGTRENPLIRDNRFTTIVTACRGTNNEPAQLVWYANPTEIIRTATRLSGEGGFITAFFPVLGLDGIQAVGGSIVLESEDFDTIMHAHLMLKSPRKGVLQLIALENADSTPEYWVPGDVTRYSTLNWDIVKSYDAFEKLYDDIVGEGKLAEDVDRRVNRFIKVDLKADILDNLAGRTTWFQWYEPPARLNSEATFLAVQVKDPVDMRLTLDRMYEEMPGFAEGFKRTEIGGIEFFERNPPEPREVPEDADEQQLRRQQRRRAMRPTPCIGMIGDYVFVADRPGIVERVVNTHLHGENPLMDDPTYKATIEKIQSQSRESKVGMVRFARPDQSFKMLFDLAKAESTRENLADQENNQFFQNLNRNLQTNPPPDASVIGKYLAPAGTLLLDDENGIHLIEFSLKQSDEEEEK